MINFINRVRPTESTELNITCLLKKYDREEYHRGCEINHNIFRCLYRPDQNKSAFLVFVYYNRVLHVPESTRTVKNVKPLITTKTLRVGQRYKNKSELVMLTILHLDNSPFGPVWWLGRLKTFLRSLSGFCAIWIQGIGPLNVLRTKKEYQIFLQNGIVSSPREQHHLGFRSMAQKPGKF